MAAIVIGNIVPVDRGEWVSNYMNEYGVAGYRILNIVQLNGNTYQSKVQNNVAEVTDTTKWLCLVDLTDAKEATDLANAAREAIEGDLALKADQTELDQLAGEVNLLDAVQGAKIKDIENVLSTANLNQSAQLSVSGASPLPLPKNAANGGMQVKIEGLTAENLYVGDYELNLNTYVNGLQSIALIKNNKYYTRRSYDVISGIPNTTITGRVSTLTPSHIFIEGNMPTSNVSVYNGDDVMSANLTAYGTQTGDIKQVILTGLRIINLTATFGAGNEPTKEQCDLMFADYFEGVKSFEPTGRIRSVDKNGLNPTALYLTAPELRSNSTVKDEIRKGANGYEHVKKVGVGTSNGEIVTGGDFSDPTKWVVSGGTSIISNGTLKLIADAGIASSVTQSKTITAGKIYRYKIDVLSLDGHIYFYIGNTPAVRSITSADSGKTISGFFLSSTSGVQIRLAKDAGSNVSAEFDNISIFEYNATEGVAIAGGEAVYGGNIHYTLATPVITPISYGGILNSAENGTVYHEPIIADAGVYGANLPILMQDYPIASIEEIIKHENGVDTYLNVATAVIAGDGLSFTHPDLASGDLVLFTYAFDKESTNGNITATFYDSNVVKIDTETGTAYKIVDTITNGILTRTLTEV